MTANALPKGLSSEEARRLLAQYGANEIVREESRPAWLLFLDQFKSPLVIVLILACLLSIVLGERIDASAIGAILIINAVIGFFQEYKAETAIAALQQMTAPRAKVLRDGRQTVILAEEVVPGDLLVLEAGDIVAADAQLIEASRLQINEAVLTGESMPVPKSADVNASGPVDENSNRVFMGTSVATGTALARVTATGMKTEFGKIAHMISTARTEATPLQIQLGHLGRSLLVVCFFVVALVAVIGTLHGISYMEVLIFSVSLAVAAVPEGMPAIVTVALALGVRRLALRNALIRRLPSVETLGSVSVICTDKTGTLTTGHMRVREVWGEDHIEVLRAAASCCDAELDESGETGVGDPTEIAILIAARERGIHKEEIEKNNPRTHVEPFDSDRKRMSIQRRDGVTYVKGAIESLLPICILSENEKCVVNRAADEMSSLGLRVLAVGVGKEREEKDLKLLGLIGIADPPRPETIPAIKEARQAGIEVIMITGDHRETAAAIAREIGLVREGESVEAKVYARATPEDKLNLVRRLKNEGEIVAMTGDGVNDAPALREAHIGIAMGRAGTEVARQTSELVLADDNFATIVAAVREGRAIFQNIRKAVTYLLTGNAAEILLVFGALLAGLPLPLMAVHLLWINLVTDSLPALTLTADPISPEIMRRPPRPPNERIMEGSQWKQVVGLGVLEAAIALGLYIYFLNESDVVHARGLVFTTVVFSQVFRSFGARSSTLVFWQLGAFTNLWLLGVVIFTVCLQLSLHYLPLTQKIFQVEPLSLHETLFILPFSLIPVTVIEVHKLMRGLWSKGPFIHQRSRAGVGAAN